MVFQRKSLPKAKQQTPAKSKKKAFENEDDMGMDFDDSDDEPMKTMTPKTPKGKQAQNDKRVSFQIPGKNSAEKTPKNAIANKKQPTPARAGGMKAFQGMQAAKNNGKAKKADSDDDDDDDDEDDDDDDDEDADLDMLLGGDDDDDDDDDEEDDDDEDDDDDDEDEEDEQPKSKKQIAKQKNQSKKDSSEGQDKSPVKSSEKTPVKATEKTPLKQTDKKKGPVKAEPESSKVASPKKVEKKDNPTLKSILDLDAERRRERDLRTLYVGNLPKDISPTELKALSADIIEAKIPKTMKKRKNLFAFLSFVSEAKAEENYKLIKGKKLRGEPILLDYSGEKSQRIKGRFETSDKPYNTKKLFIPDLPVSATIHEVAKFFPKAVQIIFNTSPDYRNATVLFVTDEDAAEAIESNKSAKVQSKPITITYSLQRDGTQIKKRKRSKVNRASPPKKMKLAVKQESDDDDDDDDDDE